MKVLAFLLCLLPAVGLAAEPEYLYNNHIYTLVPGSWYTAQQNAINWGGMLVSINDAAEENWLKGTFGIADKFWLGFTDQAGEGVWQWVNGDPVTYTNWFPGEPNDLFGEDFAVMNFGLSRQWNDSNYKQWACLGIAEKVAPEPVSSALFVLGGGALAAVKRRKKLI